MHDLSACSGRGFFGAFGSPSFTCHISRVRVDRETGVVRVLEHTAVHDYGYVVNPAGARGQVEGGALQGIGLALSEGTVYGELVGTRELTTVEKVGPLVATTTWYLDVRVTCLAEGTVLAEGTLEQVSANPQVIERYLGR